MAGKRTIIGPYRVINIGVNGGRWEVIEIQNEQGDYSELRPRKTYEKRPSAHARAARMNKHWQEDNEMEEDYDEMLKRFA